MKTGDRVSVTMEGRTVDAVVILASPNGRSLILQFEAILGGYVGMMPVLDDHGTGDFRELMGWASVKVTPQRKQGDE